MDVERLELVLYDRYWRNFQRELDNAQSDRSLIILGASLLENSLTILLEAALNGDHTSSLLRPEGALSNLATKIRLAHGLRLISEDEYADLDRIRKIRNEAAHDPGPVTFEDNDRLRDLTSALVLGTRLYQPREWSYPDLYGGEFRENDPTTNVDPPADRSASQKYGDTVDALGRALAVRITSVLVERPHPPLEEYKGLAEMDYEMLELFANALVRAGEIVPEHHPDGSLSLSYQGKDAEENRKTVELLRRQGAVVGRTWQPDTSLGS